MVQRWTGKKWRKVKSVRTRGAKDVVVVDLRRGKYRALLPRTRDQYGVASKPVRLRR